MHAFIKLHVGNTANGGAGGVNSFTRTRERERPRRCAACLCLCSQHGGCRRRGTAREGGRQEDEDCGSEFSPGYKVRPCLKRQGWNEDRNKVKQTPQVHGWPVNVHEACARKTYKYI